MPGLTVVLDDLAYWREMMPVHGPDPVAAAVIAQLAGADGIAIHLREDRRHIQERDVRLLRQAVKRRLILHMAPAPDMVGLALDIKPDRVLMVPELSNEHPEQYGMDLVIHSKNIFETVDTLQSTGIIVGICIPPEPEQAKLAHQIRAGWVQIHAGRLRKAGTPAAQRQELDRITDTVKMAYKLRLNVAIGHGLDFSLIKLFNGLSEINEFSIGGSLMSHALLQGMSIAVKDMVGLIGLL